MLNGLTWSGLLKPTNPRCCRREDGGRSGAADEAPSKTGLKSTRLKRRRVPAKKSPGSCCVLHSRESTLGETWGGPWPLPSFPLMLLPDPDPPAAPETRRCRRLLGLGAAVGWHAAAHCGLGSAGDHSAVAQQRAESRRPATRGGPRRGTSVPQPATRPDSRARGGPPKPGASPLPCQRLRPRALIPTNLRGKDSLLLGLPTTGLSLNKALQRRYYR